MIDVRVMLAPAVDVVALDLWAGEPPAFPPHVRALHVEPRRWWLIGGVPDRVPDDGALIPIGGGLVRATIEGSGWRELLSVSGWLDTACLRPGDAVGTVIHHAPVLIAPVSPTSCEVYAARSYAPTLTELWRRAAGSDIMADPPLGVA